MLNITKFEDLKLMLNKTGWSMWSIEWLRKAIVRGRSMGKNLVLREGFMGGTAFYSVPKGKTLSSNYRQDLEEKFPRIYPETEILIGGTHEQKDDGSGKTKPTKRRKTGAQPKRLQPVS